MGSTPSLSRFNALLREHVNALHLRLKEMQEQEEEETEKKNIEEDRRSLAEQVQSIVNETVDKDMYETPPRSPDIVTERVLMHVAWRWSPFRGEAVEILGKQFKGTNQTMLRILSVKDAVNELHEVVDKRGYLMAQVEGKRWKKRWFVLRGFTLYYYNKKEEQDDIAGAEGEVSLENAVVSGHDDADSKPVRARACVCDWVGGLGLFIRHACVCVCVWSFPTFTLFSLTIRRRTIRRPREAVPRVS